MPFFYARRARHNIPRNNCMSIMRQPQEGMGDGKGILKKRNTDKKGGRGISGGKGWIKSDENVF